MTSSIFLIPSRDICSVEETLGGGGIKDGLQRALRNLATNALEAMPDGGTLLIETTRDPGNERFAIVRVADTGSGIPDEIADRLFEPFVTCGKRGGTGLGLAIVRKLVDDHDGSIEVSKAEGGGTAFTLRLPLHDPS